MLNPHGIIKYKDSFLKKESPKNATTKPRYIHYDANYVKYCFLKEFYQLLFDGASQNVFEADGNELIALLTEVVNSFAEYCREHPSEENARELFRSFCKAHLYESVEKAQ